MRLAITGHPARLIHIHRHELPARLQIHQQRSALR